MVGRTPYVTGPLNPVSSSGDVGAGRTGSLRSRRFGVRGGETFKCRLLRDSEPCSRDCHFGEIKVRTLTTASLAASHLRDPGRRNHRCRSCSDGFGFDSWYRCCGAGAGAGGGATFFPAGAEVFWPGSGFGYVNSYKMLPKALNFSY
jgi:hypothetical protein